MLRPADADFIRGIEPLYEVIATNLDTNPVRWNETWFCMALALMDYRRNNLQRAETWCHAELAYRNSNAGVWLKPAAGILLAMIHHGMGRGPQAQFERAYARATIDATARIQPGGAVLVGVSVPEWSSFLMSYILLQKADAKMDPAPPEVVARAADANAKIQEIYKLEAVRQFDPEEKLLRQMPPLVLQLEGGDTGALLDELAYWRLTHGNLVGAETNWSLIVHGPGGSGPLWRGQHLSELYLWYAPLVLQLHDQQAFNRFIDSVKTVFGGSQDELDNSRVLESCLTAPASADTLSVCDAMAKKMAMHADCAATNVSTETLWLLDYRKGDFASLLARLKLHPPPAGVQNVWTCRYHILLALAEGRLGFSAQAAQDIQQSATLVEQEFNDARVPISSPGQEHWWEWWADHLLLQEARGLIRAEPIARAPNG